MHQLLWENVAADFIFDGSWRDIYVFGTDIEAWQRMLDGFRSSSYDVSFYRDGQACDLPQSVSDVFAAGGAATHMLRVRFDGVVAACHFFTLDVIEFDIDPREVKGQKEFDGVLAFMQLLSLFAKRDVVMMPENVQSVVIFRVCLDGAKVAHTPFEGW